MYVLINATWQLTYGRTVISCKAVSGVPEGIGFVDIHSHILFGADDGAETAAVSESLLDMAYRDGVRGICCTPHYYNPMVARPKVPVGIDESYAYLVRLAGEKYSDMRLWLGNEIFYHHGCIDELSAGRCRSLGGGRYVLVEFFPDEDKKKIKASLASLIGSGYIPVLAHVERYSELAGNVSEVRSLHENGTVISVNARSVVGDHGRACRHFILKLMKAGLVGIVASDAHDTDERNPILSDAYALVCDKLGESEADAMFRENALDILL